jgi:hypothetical protein
MIMITSFKTSKNVADYAADIMTKQSAGPLLTQHRDYALGIMITDTVMTVMVSAVTPR